ncbi:hypothetical protein ACFX2F_018747 [Malus domestica]
MFRALLALHPTKPEVGSHLLTYLLHIHLVLSGPHSLDLGQLFLCAAYFRRRSTPSFLQTCDLFLISDKLSPVLSDLLLSKAEGFQASSQSV